MVGQVKLSHERNVQTGSAQGHDFYHVLRVAHCCLEIAEDDVTAELAWVASIVHNADRLYPHLSEKTLEEYLYHLLETADLNGNEKLLVVTAVLNHSKRNNSEEGAVTICLKDADKVVNLEADVILRAALCRATLPMFDPRYTQGEADSAATYKNPRSMFRSLEYVLEWVDEEKGWFRLPKARALAENRAEFIRYFLTVWTEQLERSGMLAPNFPENLIANVP